MNSDNDSSNNKLVQSDISQQEDSKQPKVRI